MKSKRIKPKRNLVYEYLYLIWNDYRYEILMFLCAVITVDLVLVMLLSVNGYTDNLFCRINVGILNAISFVFTLIAILLQKIISLVVFNALTIVLLVLAVLLFIFRDKLVIYYKLADRSRTLPITEQEFRSIGCQCREDVVMFLIAYTTISHKGALEFITMNLLSVKSFNELQKTIMKFPKRMPEEVANTYPQLKDFYTGCLSNNLWIDSTMYYDHLEVIYPIVEQYMSAEAAQETSKYLIDTLEKTVLHRELYNYLKQKY